MKKILFAIGILLFVTFLMASNVFAWGTAYKTFAGAGDNQEVLAVPDLYCRIKTAYVCNDGATTSTVCVHFEGAASASNRLIPSISLAAGEGVIIDFPDDNPVTSTTKGLDIDVDISDATTINVFIVYDLKATR